jgi:hypothetical protein
MNRNPLGSAKHIPAMRARHTAERQTDPSKKLHCDGNPFTMRGKQFIIIEILE